MVNAAVNEAIYIDFEGRIEQPPVLLGELIDDGASERWCQWILDPGLATAAVARRHLSVSPLPNVAARLAEIVGKGQRKVVAWSNYEKSVLEGLTELDEHHRRVLLEHYENAIPTAKAWRRALLPEWSPAAEDLKSYFVATGFQPRLSARIARKPAAWIEHTQRRVAATGSYRKVGQTVKRDWQNLLTYNEDDCRGLRHVHGVVSRELALWRAYTATTFVVDVDRGPVHIRIGQGGRRLRRLLEGHGVTNWAFISACNPASNSLSGQENAERHRSLVAAVAEIGLAPIAGRGIPEDEMWPPEESLFVPGISEARAVALGRRFGQLAIVVGRHGEAAKLMSCRVGPATSGSETTTKSPS